MSNKTAWMRNSKMTVIARIILILASLIVVYPIIFALETSLKTNADFYTNLWGLPKVYEWSNYVVAWSMGHIGQYFLNSVIVSICSVLLSCLIAILGGYALAKLYLPKSELIIMIFMTFTFIPGIAIYISLYSMMMKMGLGNTYLIMILPFAAWDVPFSMYIFKKFFETVPSELIESARIDGCTELQAFYKIIIPLVKPAIATVIVFDFIGVWGELLWSSIATSSAPQLMTLPIGLLSFKKDTGVEWGQYAAGICIVTIPVISVFCYFQKYFIQGLTSGAVKG